MLSRLLSLPLRILHTVVNRSQLPLLYKCTQLHSLEIRCAQPILAEELEQLQKHLPRLLNLVVHDTCKKVVIGESNETVDLNAAKVLVAETAVRDINWY